MYVCVCVCVCVCVYKINSSYSITQSNGIKTIDDGETSMCAQ